MNYPIWHLPEIGGGLLIAIIAILHVVISHLAVGGGLFLVVTEIKARRSNDAALLAYAKRHTNFFMLLTMVFGGVTGVGIWFIIALVHPAATSTLIHNFVFGWAIEWVFFIGEIIALIIYAQRYDKMNPRDHQILGWLYFIFAWLSLFVINGILGFMLTPGKWLAEGGFWNGFFNPSFLPGLIFRTCISLLFAGVFGLVTAAFSKDDDLRKKVFRYCASWMYLPVIVLVLSGLYYTRVMSPESFENLFHLNPEGGLFIWVLIISSILIFALGLFTLVKLRQPLPKFLSLILVLICFGWMGGFEYLREIARKPYVLYGHMYSNGIAPSQVETISQAGILSTARWTNIREVDPNDPIPAGSEVFRLECSSCHTLNGYNGIANKIDKMTERGIEAQLTGQGSVHTYMPPFIGTDAEKKALAAYLNKTINGNEPFEFSDFTPSEESHTVPPFNPLKDEYVLLVWNDLGMHCLSDNDKYFVFLPPANTLNAQLFRRGDKPALITKGVKLLYEVEAPYQNPEKHVRFWEFADKIFGAKLKPGVGLAGKGVIGEFDAKGNYFAADLIPVTPYRDNMSYNPYPIFTIKAVDETSGSVLMETKAVAPNSTEMGCRNCHGGGWRVDNVSGVSDETAINILAIHDKYEKTNLLADAEAGNPKLCQSCHADPALGAAGQPGILNFSSAMHGFHANYLKDLYDDACNMCHPSRPGGNTLCMRGRHAEVGLTCVECHGKIEDHALALLKNEQSIGKASANRLMANLAPTVVEDVSKVVARMPWLNEPDCKSCHPNFNIANDGWEGTAFNKWAAGFDALYRNRTDNHGVRCIACHGSTHAIYPATNVYDADRDNIQPLQYQKVAGTIGTERNCKVCHIKEMTTNGHHRNMLR
jgi:cytochrome bd-type quinol oxidase subunit 1